MSTDRIPLMTAADTERESFTLVFKGDIRQFAANPFKTDTPFGRPYAIAMGDALQELDSIKTERADDRTI